MTKALPFPSTRLQPSVPVSALLMALLLVVAAVAFMTQPVQAATCNPLDLAPCSQAMTSSAPPSAVCCAKLKQQQPCFCQYKRNPALSGYINSAQAKKVSTVCGVPMPSSC